MAESAELYRPGLEGIVAGETSVSTVLQDSLAYRGYTIEDLAEHASFEETAYLLLRGELPSASQLAAFRSELDRHRPLNPHVLEVLRRIPAETPGMDVLRTTLSMAAHFDPYRGNDLDALVGRATYALAVVPGIIAARMRLLAGQPLIEPKPGLSHAAQFLYQAFGQMPTAMNEKILNLTFVLYAEHEFNASTFACRVTTSTLSDMYSALVTGIGTLKGPLHGGANEESIKAINQYKSAAEAQAATETQVGGGKLIMGFGHRVYKNGDHRARILEKYVEPLGRERNDMNRVEIYHAIKNVVWERKKIHMNVDYPCGLVYFFMGLPLDVYTPLFVASRISGWAAHAIEQFTNNRLIRPRSRYVGPEIRPYRPVGER
ncbi:MAG: citrate synthase [Planctomycetia bacterium]|nr:MAG: citrate synthase [Planctomycetia bacterium]